MGRILVGLDLLSLLEYPVSPASTSPRALHGWALKVLFCSFKSCWVGTNVIRVLSWVKPCSASWDLRVVSAFLKKKYVHLVVAPEPLAIWNKELEDLVLKLFWLFVEVLSKRTRIWLVPGSFCRNVLKWSALRKSSFGDVRFFEEKSALTECSLWASCYLEQKVRGSWKICVLKWSPRLGLCHHPSSFLRHLSEAAL